MAAAEESNLVAFCQLLRAFMMCQLSIMHAEVRKCSTVSCKVFIIDSSDRDSSCASVASRRRTQAA